MDVMKSWRGVVDAPFEKNATHPIAITGRQQKTTRDTVRQTQCNYMIFCTISTHNNILPDETMATKRRHTVSCHATGKNLIWFPIHSFSQIFKSNKFPSLLFGGFDLLPLFVDKAPPPHVKLVSTDSWIRCFEFVFNLWHAFEVILGYVPSTNGSQGWNKDTKLESQILSFCLWSCTDNSNYNHAPVPF